ncbi:hypothetical protein D3C85_1078960 [compost metagenome]
MLDHGEAPLGLVHRARAAAADLFGVPGLGDQALQMLGDLLVLGGGQVAVVARGQLRGDRIVFLDQGTPRHFGRVGGQHQLDVQAGDLARQGIGAVAAGQQALQQFGQHPRLEGLGFVRATAADAVILLGDIGQVEKLVECPRHRQQFVVGELLEAGAELFGTGGRTAPRRLGALANALDLVEKNRSALGADGVAQQLAELMNVLAQTRVDFCHD